MRHLYRTLVACIGVCLLASALLPLQAAAVTVGAGRLLGMEEAYARALQVDGELREARGEADKKRRELDQARHAVLSHQAKARGLFAKPNNLGKDIEMSTKVPEASSAYREAVESVRNKERQLRFTIELLYMQIVQLSLNERKARDKWEQATRDAVAAERLVRYGLAQPEEREEARQLVQQTESELKVAGLQLKSALMELGERTGLKLESGYSFHLDLQYALLDQQVMWQLVSQAERTNFNLSTAVDKRKLAEGKVDQIRSLYAGKFGSAHTRAVASMAGGRGVDYNLFNAHYDRMLDKIKKDWEGFFWLLIFPIPKFILQGEYDGLRYFDDQRYALPLAMMELDKARAKEEETRNNLILQVKKSYLDAKGAEELYAQSILKARKAAEELELGRASLRFGLIGQEQFAELEQAAEQAEEGVTSTYFTYRAALAKLNLDSGGAADRLLRPGLLPVESITDDGLGPSTAGEPPAAAGVPGSWSVEPVAEPLVASFSLRVGSELNATHYRVFAGSGVPLSPLLDMGQPFRHLQLLFNETGELAIMLYTDGQPAAMGSFDGYGPGGALRIEPVSDDPFAAAAAAADASAAEGGELIVGAYKLHLASVTEELLAAALSSADESGPGILYRSELAGGAWVRVDEAVHWSEAADPAGVNTMDAADVELLPLLLEVGRDGQGVRLADVSALDEMMEQLSRDKEALQETHDGLADAGKLAEAAPLAVALGDLDARLTMLQALKEDRIDDALAHMAAINNQQAILAALSSGDPDGDAVAGDPILEEAERLAGRLQELEEAIADAIAGGHAGLAGDLLAEAAQTKALLQSLEQGSGEVLSELEAIRQLLMQTFNQAALTGDTAAIDSLQGTLLSIQEEIARQEQLQAFALKSLLEEAGAEAALAGIGTAALDQALKQVLDNIRDSELSKYSAAELQALEQAAESLAEAYGGELDVLAIDQIVSAEVNFKLDLPPLQIGDSVYVLIRPVAEALGAQVIWDQEDRSVTVTMEGVVLAARIDDPIVYVNGTAYTMASPPRLILERTVVPLDFLVHHLGLRLRWDPAHQWYEIFY